jgi:hypothetical protein
MCMVYLAHMLTAAGLYVLRLGEWLLEILPAKTRITAKWWRGLTSPGCVAVSGFNHPRKNFIFDHPFYIVYLQKLTHAETHTQGKSSQTQLAFEKHAGLARQRMPFISQWEQCSKACVHLSRIVPLAEGARLGASRLPQVVAGQPRDGQG